MSNNFRIGCFKDSFLLSIISIFTSSFKLSIGIDIVKKCYELQMTKLSNDCRVTFLIHVQICVLSIS